MVSRDRRAFIISISGITTAVAGCAETTEEETSPDDESETEQNQAEEETEEEQTEDEEETGQDDASGSDDDEERDETTEEDSNEEVDADAVLSYETTEGSEWSGDLPDFISDWKKGVVVSFDVLEGSVSMEDLWFNSRIDAGERYKPASARTNDALENGIENRGDILEDGSADILYEVPTYSDTHQWNLSGLERQSVTGEDIEVDTPGEEFYPDVSVSVDIEITDDAEMIPQEANEFKNENEAWGIASLEVLDGRLNVEDVWFRSKLRVTNRQVETDPAANRYVKRGMRPRGEIKSEYIGHAIYIVPGDSEDASWITDEMRQSVTIE